jgi:hypothetical protein
VIGDGRRDVEQLYVRQLTQSKFSTFKNWYSKMVKPKIFLALLASCFIGCQTSYHTVVNDDPTFGELYVEVSSNIQHLSIEIDERTHFRDNNVRNVRLSGIEPGERNIRVLASGDNRVANIDHEEIIEITPGENHEIFLQAPSFTMGYYAMHGIIPVGTVALSLWLLN